MGYVWRATDEATGSAVAIKLLKGSTAEDRKRFQREVRAAAAIRHPSVVAVHDFIELPGGLLAIVMDLLEGETLGAVLRRDRQISLPDLSTILLPVVSALEAAHALGIVHRDLKPDNVFLCGTRSTLDVKVLDFGVAKLTASDGLAAQTQALTGTGSMVGTPYYMSPEQVFADKDLDARADIWSLGVILYECLTGTRPTEADTIGRVLKRIMVADIEPIVTHRADLPEDVVSLVGRMLSGDREQRPQRMSEIREVLERHEGDLPPMFSRASSLQPIDPHAPTLSTPEAAAPGPASVPDAAPSPSASPSDRAGTDTSDPVSLVAARPSGARVTRRVVVALAVVGLAAVAGAVALRTAGDGTRATPTVVAAGSGEPTSALPPAPKELPSGVAAAPSSSEARVAAPSPSAVPTTWSPPPRVVAPAASVRASAPARADGGAPVACDAREVLSNGHCCPRGLVWQFDRCERPIATTF
jgi:serine/threonine-protein kinase